MCAPVVGAISAVSGIASAVGGYQSQSAAVAAQNKAAINNYKYQVAQRENDWRQTLTAWGHKRLQYKAQTDENFLGAQKGYQQEQQRLNEIYQKARFTNQDQLNKMLASQGMNYARGATGQSAQRSNAMMLAALGRSQAQTAASLASARDAADFNKQSIRDQLISANRQAYGQVALKPVAGIAPPPPVLQSGPSALSLIGGIGSAVASGFSTYNSLKAPNPGDLGGKSVPSDAYSGNFGQLPSDVGGWTYNGPGLSNPGMGNSYDYFGTNNPFLN